MQKTKRSRKSTSPEDTLSLKKFFPKTPNQKEVFDVFAIDHLLLYGCAGTGKTFTSIYLALDSILIKHKFKKLYIVRSAVPVRDIGFLPGTDKEKMAVYEMPYIQIFKELFGKADAYEKLKEQGIVEFIPTSFIRGLTLDDCIIVVDEIQNCNDEEINSVVTRLGKNAKLILSGDTAQIDLYDNKKSNISGMHNLLRIVRNIPSFSMVEFNEHDILRNDLVYHWIVERRNLGI